jgi:hypothetical protein
MLSITLNRSEVTLLRKKLKADAEWALGDVAVAEDVLRKLQAAEPRRRER